MAKAKKEKFPQIQYIVKGASGDCYFSGPDLTAVAQLGEKTEVGIYKLSEIVEVEGKAVIVR